MKYFTPELFAQANSDDEESAEQAAAQWEKAGRRYLKYIRGIRDKLPAKVGTFMDACNLHDAELHLAPGSPGFLPFWIRYGIDDQGPVLHASLAFRQEGHELTLNYGHLIDRPTIARPVESPVFYQGVVICLYDEFSSLRGGGTAHELLFSNGYMTRIRFREFSYDRRPLAERPTALFTELSFRTATG